MIFTATALPGVYLIELERIEDERGYFARSFCEREFAAHGLPMRIAQCNVSFNATKGTLRGLHYQEPCPEAKLVRCARGAIYDVVVDRVNRRWAAFELSGQDDKLLYIPEGLAHGFQTLEDATEVHYQMSEAYRVEVARGIRHDDPALAISWPLAVTVMSERDRAYPLLDPERA